MTETLWVYRAGFAGDIVFSSGAVRQIRRSGKFGEIRYGCWAPYADCIVGNPNVDVVQNCNTWTCGKPSWEVSHEKYRLSHPDAMKLYWGEQHARQACELGFLDEVDPDCRPDLYLLGAPPETPSRVALISAYSTNGVGKRLWRIDGTRVHPDWGRVVDILRKKGYTVAQTGTTKEPKLPCDYDLRGKTRSLMDYFHLVSRADLLLTIDTLPLHLAASRFYLPHNKLIRDGIPCIALCGPTGRPGVIPDNAPWIVEVSKLPNHKECRCWESTPFGGFRCPYDNKCMRDISVEDVERGLDVLEASRS